MRVRAVGPMRFGGLRSAGARIWHRRAACQLVAPAKGKRGVTAADAGQDAGQIEQHVGDDMDYIAFALGPPGYPDHRAGEHKGGAALAKGFPDHQVGDAGLIFPGG